MSTDTPGSAPRITLDVIAEHIVHEHYFTAKQGARMALMDGLAQAETHEEAADTAESLLHLPWELGLLTICVLTLRNGFTILGKSACASPANFSQEIGEKVAREDAIRQIWPLLGYELRSKLNSITAVGDDKLGEALTMMTAHRLGNSEAFLPVHAETILSHFHNDEGEEGGRTFKDPVVNAG
jgi:hypothetical protein